MLKLLGIMCLITSCTYTPTTKIYKQSWEDDYQEYQSAKVGCFNDTTSAVLSTYSKGEIN